jgi:hypothetical protein
VNLALTGLPRCRSGTITTMTSSPFDEANEADVAEQLQSVRDQDDPVPTPPSVPLDEANEADALEQGAEVGEDDDGYDR